MDKIAIISDTHGNLPKTKKVIDFLNKENISFIIHCGDIGSPQFLKEALKGFKGEAIGVLGNMDIRDVYSIEGVTIYNEVGEVEISGKKIAFTHFPERAKELAEKNKYDFIFYGHTHKPWEEKIKNCRLINPGNVAGVFYRSTFAIYSFKEDKLELKILE